MSSISRSSRLIALLVAPVFLLGIGTTASFAQSPQPTHKKSFIQRHPNLTSAAAGVAAYKVAKKTGQNRAATGRKKNFAQRHPVLTGMAAAAATHHYIKKSEKRH